MNPKKSSLKRFAPVVAGLAIAGLLAGCSSAKDPSAAETIRMAIYPTNLPGWCELAASQQGFYKDAGIDVEEPLVVQNDADALRAIQAGEANIAMVTNVIQVASTGAMKDKPIMITQSTDLPASFIGPGKEGSGLKGLAGLRIGLPPEGQATTAVALDVLEKALGKDGFEPVFVGGGGGSRVAAIRSGAVDAAFVFAPLDRVAIKDDPALSVLATIDDSGVNYGASVYAAKESWLKDNGDIAGKWAQAFSKGCSWVHAPENREAAIDLLAKAMKVDPAIVTATYDEYITKGNGRSVSPDGVVDAESIANIQSALMKAGYQDKEINVADYINAAIVGGNK